MKKNCSSSLTTDVCMYVCMYVVAVNSFVCFSVAVLEHKLFLGFISSQEKLISVVSLTFCSWGLNFLFLITHVLNTTQFVIVFDRPNVCLCASGVTWIQFNILDPLLL